MHDVLFSNHVSEDEDAYFYAITARCKDGWYPYYIGMVYDQAVSVRHKGKDHLDRLARLKQQHPTLNFGISLGVIEEIRPQKLDLKRDYIEDIESLLIYANWHEDMDNCRKVDYIRLRLQKQIHIENIGFIDHLEKEIFYGVTYRSD